MNLVGLIFLILIVLSIFTSGTGIITNKRRRNRNYSDKSGQSETGAAFATNKAIWQQNVQKTVDVPDFKYQENFNEFPFFSDYQESKAFLIKHNATSRAVNTFLKNMEGYESQLARYWNEAQRRLLRSFDQSGLNTSKQGLDFALKYYNLFLDAFRYEVITYLVDKILVAELGRALDERPATLPPGVSYDQYIRTAMDYFYMTLNDDVNKVIGGMQQEIQSQFYQSAFNAGQQQNWQGSSFQNDFDEVGMAYKTLETKPEATDDELKTNYRRLAKKYHPDRNPSEEAKTKMAKINSAYDLIKKIRNMK